MPHTNDEVEPCFLRLTSDGLLSCGWGAIRNDSHRWLTGSDVRTGSMLRRIEHLLSPSPALRPHSLCLKGTPDVNTARPMVAACVFVANYFCASAYPDPP